VRLFYRGLWLVVKTTFMSINTVTNFTYSVKQDEDELTVSFLVPEGTRSKDLNISIITNEIRAGLKSKKENTIEGILFDYVENTLWQLESNMVTIHLEKKTKYTSWPILIVNPTSQGKIDVYSQYELGKYYQRQASNDGFSKAENQDFQKKANEYFEGSANRGFSAAQFTMGLMYEKGRGGFNKSCEEAIKWYLRAAEKNHAKALYHLGKIYRQGRKDEKISPDISKAKTFLRRSAKGGNEKAFELFKKIEEEENGKKRSDNGLFWIGTVSAVVLLVASAFILHNITQQQHSSTLSRR